MWLHKSSKKQIHAFPIQELEGSPNETKSSLCFVDLCLHLLGKLQVSVHKCIKSFSTIEARKSCWGGVGLAEGGGGGN